jgi:hypothetical protein
MIVEQVLGERGREYMRDTLLHYSGAALHLGEVVRGPGCVFTVLPAGIDTKRAWNFESGGLWTVNSAWAWLLGDLASRAHGTVIFQDVLLRPSDVEMLPPLFDNYFIEDDQVYYYLALVNLRPDRLEQINRYIKSFQPVVFHLAEFVMSFEERRRRRVLPGFLARFLPSTMSVYLSAYDQESWIIWRSASVSDGRQEK